MDANLYARLGNLHLVLLHLPIGFVVAALLLAWWRWRKTSPEGGFLLCRLLAINAVAALSTAGFGLLLAETGGYPEQELAWHRWAGVICAGVAILAWWTQARHQRTGRGRVPAAVALAGLFAATIVAGHFGAVLTHGPGVSAWFGGGKPVGPVATAPVVPSGELFTAQIQPILAKHCYECHGPERQKGKLRLDLLEAARRGGKSGRPALVPGDAASSELVRRIKLPRTDEEAMPPEDEPGMTAAEIAIVEKWIVDGAKGL